MTLSLILALVWLILANVLALIPSRDNHWSRAYLLIALGVPLLGYVTYENGPVIALVLLAAGASVLRWRASDRSDSGRPASASRASWPPTASESDWAVTSTHRPSRCSRRAAGEPPRSKA